jgi:hypothetical protein
MYREVDSSDQEDLDKAEFIDKDTCGAELLWVKDPEIQKTASKFFYLIHKGTCHKFINYVFFRNISCSCKILNFAI